MFLGLPPGIEISAQAAARPGSDLTAEWASLAPASHHPTQTEMNIIDEFYTAFTRGDAKAMTACYHDEVEFEDPAFGKLKGARAKAMWEMLVSRATDLKVIHRNVKLDGNKGSADWDAEYTFAATGRKVLNKIHAEFELRDGKIYRHTDTFNLHKWAKQALGFKGWLLGGTNFFKKKLHAQTSGLLDKYLQGK